MSPQVSATWPPKKRFSEFHWTFVSSWTIAWSTMTLWCIVECVDCLYLQIIKNRKGMPLVPISEIDIFHFEMLMIESGEFHFRTPKKFHVKQRSQIIYRSNILVKQLNFQHFQLFLFFSAFSWCVCVSVPFFVYRIDFWVLPTISLRLFFAFSFYEPFRQWLGWQFTGGSK